MIGSLQKNVDLINKWFDGPELSVDEFEPLYYLDEEMPAKLNPTRYSVLKMSPQILDSYLTDLQQYLLELYNARASWIGSTMNRGELIKTLRELNELNTVENKEVFDDGFLVGFKHYERAVNNWFPEMVAVDISTTKSLLGVVADFETFKKKFIRIVIDNKPNDYGKYDFKQKIFPAFKRPFGFATGNQAVTNIRCAVAKRIYQSTVYEHFKDEDEIVIWDPSMGWAGRLAAFLASVDLWFERTSEKGRSGFWKEPLGKKWLYIGTDPNSVIKDRYSKIYKFWCANISNINDRVSIKPLCCGSEVFHNTPIFKKYAGKGMIVYTSPPYFNKEQYSGDEQQSFKKFSKYEAWRDGFLKQTIQNSYNFLRTGGFFFWNIADIKSGSKMLPLEADSVKFAEQVGFKHVKTLKQLMGPIPGYLKGDAAKSKNIEEYNGKKRKFEPVFVFRK